MSDRHNTGTILVPRLRQLVPGPGFIKSGGSVGDRIRINVLADDVGDNLNHQLDTLRSGDFIVYNTRHQFSNTMHNVAMTVNKLEQGCAVSE